MANPASQAGFTGERGVPAETPMDRRAVHVDLDTAQLRLGRAVRGGRGGDPALAGDHPTGHRDAARASAPVVRATQVSVVWPTQPTLAASGRGGRGRTTDPQPASRRQLAALPWRGASTGRAAAGRSPAASSRRGAPAGSSGTASLSAVPRLAFTESRMVMP